MEHIIWTIKDNLSTTVHEHSSIPNWFPLPVMCTNRKANFSFTCSLCPSTRTMDTWWTPLPLTLPPPSPFELVKSTGFCQKWRLDYIRINSHQIFKYKIRNNTIYMYSGITSGRVFDGELLYAKILEVNLFAFACRWFHRDFSPINGAFCIHDEKCPVDRREIFMNEKCPVDWREISMKQSVGKCKQINF